MDFFLITEMEIVLKIHENPIFYLLQDDYTYPTAPNTNTETVFGVGLLGSVYTFSEAIWSTTLSGAPQL